APHRHVRLQLRPPLPGARDRSAAGVHAALLRGAGGGALAVAVRSPRAMVALAEGAAHQARPRRGAEGVSGGLRRRGADFSRSAAGSQRHRAGADLAGGGAGRVLRLVPLAQALAALVAARSLLDLRPAEPARRAHRRLPDELARRAVLLAQPGARDPAAD